MLERGLKEVKEGITLLKILVEQKQHSYELIKDFPRVLHRLFGIRKVSFFLQTSGVLITQLFIIFPFFHPFYIVMNKLNQIFRYFLDILREF